MQSGGWHSINSLPQDRIASELGQVTISARLCDHNVRLLQRHAMTVSFGALSGVKAHIMYRLVSYLIESSPADGRSQTVPPKCDGSKFIAALEPSFRLLS